MQLFVSFDKISGLLSLLMVGFFAKIARGVDDKEVKQKRRQ